MFRDCDDPLCGVHRDPAERFARWPESQLLPGRELIDAGEWVVDLLPADDGVVAVAADGGVVEWVSGGVSSGVGGAGGPGARWWREADGASVLVNRAPSGQLAVAGPGRLSLLDGGNAPATDLAVAGRPTAITWHPDGGLVVAAYGRTIVAVDPAGVEVARCDQLPSNAAALVFDRLRSRFGAVIRKGVVWLDAALVPTTFHAVLWDDGLRSAAFSPDGSWLAIGCYGGTTLLWGEGEGETNRSTSGPPGPGEVLAWSADGHLLAVAHDQVVALHAVGAAPTYIEVPARPQALCWAAQGPAGEPGPCLLAGCGNELVEWVAPGGALLPEPRRRWNCGAPVTAIAVTGEGCSASVVVGLGNGAVYAL